MSQCMCESEYVQGTGSLVHLVVVVEVPLDDLHLCIAPAGPSFAPLDV